MCVVLQILEQCNHRLGLSQAARRLYTADGLMVLDLDDLVEWVRENYVEQATVQLRAAKKPGQKSSAKGGKGTWPSTLTFSSV